MRIFLRHEAVGNEPLSKTDSEYLFCGPSHRMPQKPPGLRLIIPAAGFDFRVDTAGRFAAAVPPYTYGSHKSKLISVLQAGHYDVKLPRGDFIRLVTWVDANAPYYGSYFGRRNLAWRDRPDFRPVPTLESALGIRPVPP